MTVMNINRVALRNQGDKLKLNIYPTIVLQKCVCGGGGGEGSTATASQILPVLFSSLTVDRDNFDL